MALDKNVELLGGVPLFSGLAPDKLAAIVAIGKKSFFEDGAPIIKRRTKGKTGYLILSGRAVTKPPKTLAIEPETLEAGTLVGEMAMLTDTIYSLDVVVDERVRALAIDREALFGLLEQDPSIAYYLAEQITERLVFLARDLRDVDARFAALEASLDEAMASAG